MSFIKLVSSLVGFTFYFVENDFFVMVFLDRVIMNDCSMFLDSIGNVFKFVSLYERDDVDPVKTASYKQTINPFV